ncbi:MAG: thiamine biosynthesis protein ThiF [Ruminococcaceae bacterium]|nr:thiamine biosynthesis protein ThiF [Oscillospiraceae bacterium]
MVPDKEEWIKALSDRHGAKLQKKISSTVVAVCGLGGLGSNIAIALARSGFGKLILIDCDRVDITNIHRQQYKINQIGMSKTEALLESLKEINPYIEVKIHNAYLNESNAGDILSDANIICEAFDNAECKAMLTNFVLEKMPDKYIVAASGMAGLDSSNLIKTRKVSKRFYLCGDEVSDVGDGLGLVSTRVMLCAAHQAHTVLRITAEEYEV